MATIRTPQLSKLQIKVVFDCTWENEVVVERNGVRVFNSISANYQTPREGTIPTPDGADFTIYGRHKVGGPSGDLPWIVSEEQVFKDTDKKYTVRYDDGGGDKDFNDAVVTLEILPIV
jgi:hypothetical protein